MYEFVTGPLALAAILIFFFGSAGRIAAMLLLAKKDKVVYPYLNLHYGLRSLFHWVLPFGARNMRMHPFFTVFSFLFHIGVLALPLFLRAHLVMWERATGLTAPALPEALADTLTVIVLLVCFFFLLRRIVSPEVRYVTTAGDYLLLLLVAAPFITGFLATHQWTEYRPALLFHVLLAELLLVLLPFTRISHMLFFPLTRMYMGAEFGAVRHSKDW
ncbi:MAG: nitrate reductase [Deltaproteobacteria bacterium RIFOXYA12_FULL_61_11]|nr:MAG: nitrate reductase [Deltaproteobacteria bacterium RIFOXYA12_FULL_61_11]